AELDRVQEQLKPLYVALHAYVRRRLQDKYGKDIIGADGLIPQQLTGNMWGQSWENIYDLVKAPSKTPSFDLTKQLVANKYDEKKMVEAGEGFFTSLGFDKLPS